VTTLIVSIEILALGMASADKLGSEHLDDLVWATCILCDRNDESFNAWISVEQDRLPGNLRGRVFGNPYTRLRTVTVTVSEYLQIKSSERSEPSTMKWIKLEDDSSRTDKSLVQASRL